MRKFNICLTILDTIELTEKDVRELLDIPSSKTLSNSDWAAAAKAYADLEYIDNVETSIGLCVNDIEIEEVKE